MANPLRVGLFPYLNVQAIIAGLRGEKDLELVIDVPSAIADRFRKGELDAAMAPSFEAATMGARVLDGVCIGSDGPVETVVLHHRMSLEHVQTLSLDAASRTSAALAKILIAEASGALPETSSFRPGADQAPDTDAILVIGDPAFTFSKPGYAKLDLGQEWRRRYGLPFVFAVVVLGPGERGAALASLMARAATRGLEEAATIAASYNSGVDSARAEHYLRKVIRYDLGRREKEGLAHFYRLAQANGLLTQVKELQFHAI
jgi:predicted solute-binding protein